jgi:hypothetical protein
MSDYRNVPVKAATKVRLLRVGKKGETWDALVNRILDALETPEGGKAEASSAPVAAPRSQGADG